MLLILLHVSANHLMQLNIDVPFFAMNMGLSGCTQVKPSAFPRYKAFWTCGTRVRGSSVCTASKPVHLLGLLIVTRSIPLPGPVKQWSC